MSVLNQSGEEQVECPLCMEPLEVDDLNFYPCTCGYQICRFCWHRIRLDENGGLCPHCRKAYSENPADFIPLSREQVAKLKAEKKQRDQQRKAKLTESRKHLASVRVVQKNLVFVVGLPPRLADAEILKRHEYFGKFGKIHKVVINQSTSYAGSQGPSASAYVTYMKSDDALRAIQAVNNVTIDNRIIKSSLGTTKYCSHFMKNQPCPKPDCMYLHEYGDPDASFTKEQMHAGKHQEYEKKLHEELLIRTKSQNGTVGVAEGKTAQTHKGVKDGTVGSNSSNLSNKDSNSTNKENWPQLDKDKKQEKDKARKGKTKNSSAESRNKDKCGNSSKSNTNDSKVPTDKNSTSINSHIRKTDAKETDSDSSPQISASTSPSPSPSSTQTPPLQASTPPTPTETSISYSSPITGTQSTSSSITTKLSSSLINDQTEDNSYFSSSGFSKLQNPLDNLVESSGKDESGLGNIVEGGRDILQEEQGHQVLTDTLPVINTTEDWAAAFGLVQHREDDLLQQLFPQIDVTKIVQRDANKIPQREVSKLSNFPGFNSLTPLDGGFGKEFYEMSKLQENLIDALPNKSNGYNMRSHEANAPQPTAHVSNVLEHNMSKFFSDFHKYNTKEPPSSFQNGSNGLHNYYPFPLPQKSLEEQLMNLGLKQNTFVGPQTTGYQNGLSTSTYSNGDSTLLNGGLTLQGLYQRPQLISTQSHSSRNSEAELDFDPFQETQKALAEMMANEQMSKTSTNSNARNGQPINGIVQNNQSGNHIPPPPPGFLQQQQQQTHMNSFGVNVSGSKILPYLNMSNSQQQINNMPNNWPSSYNSQMQPQKNIPSTDWKVLDPAILSSSRNFQLAQMPPPVRDPYTAIPPLGNQQITQNGLLRSYDYPQNNSPFPSFTQQIQPNFNTFTHINTPQNLTWFTNDLNSQISSPPGFRNSQTSKQQEC